MERQNGSPSPLRERRFEARDAAPRRRYNCLPGGPNSIDNQAQVKSGLL
jgi:hypothetical protein